MTPVQRRAAEKALMEAFAKPPGQARTKAMAEWSERWGWALLVAASIKGVGGVLPTGSDAA